MISQLSYECSVQDTYQSPACIACGGSSYVNVFLYVDSLLHIYISQYIDIRCIL